MARRAALKEQVGALWRQAVDQLDDVREVVRRRGFEPDMAWLKSERDRLLALLGEQTYKLANQGKYPMPTIVKRTVDRLNEVIHSMTQVHGTSAYTESESVDVDSALNGAEHSGTNHAAPKKRVSKKSASKSTYAKSTSNSTSKKSRSS